MKLMKMMGMICIASTALLTACNKDDDKEELSDMDRNFVILASYGNHNEIAAGQIAASRGGNAGVRTFGNQMVTDHSAAQDELEELADDFDVNIPNEPDSLHKAEAMELQMLSGQPFDEKYMTAQVRDHQITIDLFNHQIASGNNHRLRNYAQKWLPGVMHHKHMADSLKNVVD